MWQQNRPLTRTEIIKLSPERSWKASSIHILLNKMLDKKAIIVDGFIRTGKNYGRTYSPAFSREEYEKMLLKHQYKNASLSLGKLFAALIEDEEISDSTIDELEAIIRKRREKGK
jgi:predicted transcriptional regulator